MTSTLIVPIDLAALCVGQPDTQSPATLAPMANFTQLPQPGATAAPYLSTTVTAQGQPFQGETNFVQGIHLHWALPDALTQGAGTAKGLQFPTVPNRWLVTRILVNTSSGQAVTSTRSWVIESDRLSATPAPNLPTGFIQPTVPVADAETQPNYLYLGQSFDLVDATGAVWSETTASRLTPLTALGYGEPTFAAFYPNCGTVFGHVDTFADLPEYDPTNSTVAYHVCGWYATASDDPLSPGTANPSGVPPQWAFTSGATPTQTVLSGVIQNITWNAGQQYLTDTQNPNPMTAAIASSPAEALSALMASQLQGTEFQGAEQLLNALQFGLLSQGGTVDSLAGFEEDVQAAGFASLPAGVTWTIGLPPTTAAQRNAGTSPTEATLPVALAEMLWTLNDYQSQLNDLTQTLNAQEWQLFTDWCKYLIVLYQSSTLPTALQGVAGTVQQYLQGEIDAINDLNSKIATLTHDIQKQQATVEAALPSPYQLTSTAPAPTYYQPHDPVLVLAGDDVTPVGRYGNDGANSADGRLPCRLDSELVTALAVAAGLVTGSAALTVAGSNLPGLAAIPAGSPGQILQTCMREAFFLSSALQPVIAGMAASGSAALVPALQTGLGQFLSGTPISGMTYTGTAPDAIMMNDGSATPWLPLVLQYRVTFFPVRYIDPQSGGAGYSADFITSQFDMTADSLDLVYTGAAPNPNDAQVYSGSVVLTDKASYDLAAAIQNFITNNPDAELSDILTQVQGLRQLSQGLGGLNQAMLMRQQTLQMPVADPFAGFNLAFVTQVNQAVAQQTIVAPMPENSFNPIRTGSFNVGALRLVDVFGRWKDYPSPTVVVSQGLTPPAALSLPAGTAFLPPRITQPARLLFNWVSAADREVETNSHPATSPIIGIVVPNFLDNSLLVYSAAGAALAVFTLSADGSSVGVTPAPGGSLALNTPVATIFANQNSDLIAFARALTTNPAAFFAAFLSTIKTALTSILPASFRENAGMAVLTGQPLALARAALGLDLAGPPATDESWTSFANSALEGAASNDFGWSSVQFPVMLGTVNKLNDTLVGYFLEPKGTTDYTRFFEPGGTSSAGGVQPTAQTTLTLPPERTSGESTTVLMLLDPRGSVHATTGILPVQQLQIPPDQYATALKSLSLSFTAGPVLSGSNTPVPQLAVPQVGSGQWSWDSVSAGAWVTQALSGSAPTQATLSYSPQQIADGWLTLAGDSAGS